MTTDICPPTSTTYPASYKTLSLGPWCAGALFIRASQEWLHQFEDVRFEGLQGASARKTLLLVGVMAAHALGEGSGVGVSFCGHRGWAQVRAAGRAQSIAEREPHEISDLAPLPARLLTAWNDVFGCCSKCALGQPRGQCESQGYRAPLSLGLMNASAL